MMKLDNAETTRIIQHAQQSKYDDNKDIIWLTVVGLFVALALGWMICRYKCSSEERSPHIVRCCPKSLCKKIRLCCQWTFRFNNESQQQRQNSGSDLRIQINKERLSNNSVLEIPFMRKSSTNHSLSLTRSSQQWPPPFLLNSNQGPSFPLSISIQPTINPSQPQRYPLHEEAILTETENSDERRDSSPCPFRATNTDFHEQTNDIKQSHLFFNT
ncbi:unnamed protein product [Rotaria sp. Silwood1]|nr:unnamed protein product [Rotaria sp. Silwood1]CAF4838648.1 unnamed protein product [Rotaria sp. Silwood1]